MEVSKIQLSKAETELMQNAEIILTKNRVLQKMTALLEELQALQIVFVRNHLLYHEVFDVSPKISRGENYQGLPYLILDYPRLSSGNHLFFIRSMFWWGKFFSSTLHISGRFKESFSGHIKDSLSSLSQHSIGINTDPWVHHFEKDNYRSMASLSINEYEEICNEVDHLKIGIHFPLQQWPDASMKLLGNWKLYLHSVGLIPNTV